MVTLRELYERFSSAVAYVDVELASGDRSIGTAFHVGEGVFLTARHVVADCKILKIATTVGRYVGDPDGNTTIHGEDGRFRWIAPSSGTLRSAPLLHPVETIDVAALLVDGIDAPAIPLGSHLDDWLNDEDFVLRKALVMGYPRVPLSKGPVLIASEAEINAVIDKYTGGHPHFIVSSVARGGFSGGPCLIDFDFALGLVTESLNRDQLPVELGYTSVVSVEPLFTCMASHGIVPACQKEGWGGTWG